MDFKKMFDFLSELKENNNKPWFDENRKRYEDIKKDWQNTVTALIKKTSVFDTDIGELEAKDCLFRINRDVRFSKDKSPYKTNFGTYLSKGGKKSIYAGYYVHLDPSECFIGCGSWMPEPAHLQAIRQEIDYHFDGFKGIVEKPSFLKLFGRLQGEKISTVPKGFEKDNPAIEYLRHKSFIASFNLDKEKIIAGNFEKTVVDAFNEAKPLIDFINRAISN